jgi:hypothetical protein
MHQALMIEPRRARERDRNATGVPGDISPELTTDLVLGGISALVSVLLK